MLKNFKNFLSRIIRTKRGILFLVLIFISLFTAVRPAQAFIGTGLFDYAMSAMGGLADLGGWAFAIFFALFVAVGLSSALVAISASLLEWSMSLQIGLDNAIVQSGWQFTLGLANLFFILIFIYIALAFILRVDTLRMKKALPNLIIIALLINFSLLLVGIFVDAATFFQNTILSVMTEGESLAGTTIEALTGGAARLTGYLATTLGVAMIGLAIPFVDIATMIGTIGLSLAFLPNIISGFFIAILNIIVGIIFLFYAVLFMARVVVIWLLAIFAPLAFLSYILPDTKKFFNQWIHALLSWSFLGIIALFLLMLGLKLAVGTIGGLVPAGGYKDLPQYIGFYIFFIIYFVISLIISKKLAPMGTDVVWKYGGMAINKGGTWSTEKASRLGTRAKIKQQEGMIRAAKKLEAKVVAGGVLSGTERLRGWGIRRLGGKELAEAQVKGLKARLLDKEREKILSKAPKDPKAREAYLRGELLKQGQRGHLRDRNKIASLIDLITDSGKIGSAEEKFVADAIKHGANEKKILDRRPDLAAAAGKTIEEVIRGMNAETLRKQTQKEAFRNRDVMKHFLVDESKFSEITFRASAEVKKLIKESFRKNAAYLHPRNLPPSQRNAYKGRVKRMFQTDSRWKV